MDESFQPLIPYGFFTESYMDLNDSSLIIQYDPRVIIERPNVVCDDLDGSLMRQPSQPIRVNKKVFRPLDYIRVSVF